MSVPEPSFTVGIEEEYMIVDPATGALVTERPDAVMAECERLLEEQVTPEFLRSQIEIGTRVCASMAEARDDLAHLRRTVTDVAARHGLKVIAASTHPFSAWDDQVHTDKERYNILAQDLQTVARRLLTCGMHVHVGIDDDELRIDLLSQIAYFVPHLLVLSTSSPFWRGEDTGLKSYRVAVFDELPRTGLPEQFDSWGEFQRHLDVLIKAGLIEDASKIWWDVRPSSRFPTLEMRIMDVCTHMDDALCIAALYRCILRMLWRLRRMNQRWRRYANMLIAENRWRAQRYGFEEGLVDYGKSEIVAYHNLLEELIELTRPDAEYFGCVGEVEHARKILRMGTSAHWQRATFEKAVAAGKSKPDALKAVVDMLAEETVAGL